MSPLEDQILSRIRAAGPIPFSEFMETCLYDRVHGYYAAAKARIGRGGDFVTAVSAGAIFGKLLARQFVEMWKIHGSPSTWTLVEQGAFDGQLCLDVLEALDSFAPECLRATSVQIVEPFAPLRERQSATLKAFASKIHWHETLETLDAFEGVHYSNELLDAFPVHILRSTGHGWEELRVARAGDTFCWEPGEITEPSLRKTTGALPSRDPGFLFEVRPQSLTWLGAIHRRMKRGWLLSFDYGMTEEELLAPHRRDGTLAAYRSHVRQKHPLAFPGEMDLTAHVNFTAIAREASAVGWTLEGYTDQHRFFTGLIPHHFDDAVSPLTQLQQKELLSLKTLIHPQLMGVQFKVLCLGTGEGGSLSGFKHCPRRMTERLTGRNSAEP